MKNNSQQNNHVNVWVEINNEQEKTALLNYAKIKGFTWISGAEINPETDRFGFHFGLDFNKKIGYIPPTYWIAGKNSPNVTILDLNTLLAQATPFGE